jgi:L-ascorbate metabolism protein UlaG (beta-lactamase superfamily)
MTIHFLGLSCFLIENAKGYRILVDPFSDEAHWGLGPMFPKELKGEPLGANLVLVSESDADHSGVPRNLLQNGSPTKPGDNPFPDLNLRGTIIHEYNGDLNIAWHYTLDGVRLAHFADIAHVLNEQQMSEVGHPDIIFLPMPKADSQDPHVLNRVRENIKLLKPKLVICAHHIVPRDLPSTDEPSTLRAYFRTYFKGHACQHCLYRGEESFIELCYVLENALRLAKEYPSMILDTPTLEITPELLARGAHQPIVILFRVMYANEVESQPTHHAPK